MKVMLLMKNQTLYKRVHKIIQMDEFFIDVLPYIPDVDIMREFLQIYSPSIAIIDDNLSWKEIALDIIRRIGIKFLLFEGDFSELEKNWLNLFNLQERVELTPGTESKTDLIDETNVQEEWDGSKVLQKEVSQSEIFPSNQKSQQNIPKFVPKVIVKEIKIPVEVEKPIYIEKPIEVTKVVNRYLNLPSKTILVGSLSPRSGSTFVAMNFARMLSTRDLLVSVIEYPGNLPYIYDALKMREKHPNYKSWAAQIDIHHDINTRYEVWEYGVLWIALDPSDDPIKNFTYEKMFRLMNSVRMFPFTIIDISNRWFEKDVQYLLDIADEILLVVEPDPVILDRLAYYDQRSEQYQEYLIKNHFLEKLNQSDFNITVIFNKDFGLDKQIKDACFTFPYLSLKFFDFADVNAALWNGSLVYDIPKYRETFENVFYQLLRRMLPVEFRPKSTSEQINVVNFIKNLLKKGDKQ